MKPLHIVPFLLLALPGAVLPALAFEHAPTGFGLTLPDAFIIDADVPQNPDYAVLVGVRAASGTPAPVGADANICQAGFQGGDANQGMTQAEVNALITDEAWTDSAKASLETLMIIDSYTGFDLAGVGGVEVVATPKSGPDAKNVRLVVSMMETPGGRTVLTCVATGETLDAALPVFRSIRAGIVPPG